MNLIRLSRCTLTLLLFLISGSFTAVMSDDDDHDRARRLRESGEILPLETILNQLIGLGRVLEVELESEHGRHVYEIELLDNQGVVRELIIDAHSGKQLRDKVGD